MNIFIMFQKMHRTFKNVYRLQKKRGGGTFMNHVHCTYIYYLQLPFEIQHCNHMRLDYGSKVLCRQHRSRSMTVLLLMRHIASEGQVLDCHGWRNHTGLYLDMSWRKRRSNNQLHIITKTTTAITRTAFLQKARLHHA